MAKKKDDSGLVWGVVLIALGCMFLAQQFFNIEVFRWLFQLWPVVLIVWGIMIVKNSRAS